MELEKRECVLGDGRKCRRRVDGCSHALGFDECDGKECRHVHLLHNLHWRSSGRDEEHVSAHRERGGDATRHYSAIRWWWFGRSAALAASGRAGRRVARKRISRETKRIAVSRVRCDRSRLRTATMRAKKTVGHQ